MYISDNFISDNLRQLKCGMECYVFSLEQAELIKKIFFEKTNVELKIKKIENDYYLLKPTKKVNQYHTY